jgi:phosphoribosyl-dephospho-CoA transferase
MAKRRYKFDPPSLAEGRRGNRDFLDVWNSRGWGAVHSIKYSAMVIALSNWDKHMARKTYRIELKIDLTDEGGHEAMLAIAKQYARDLLGSAMMLSERQRPMVALMTDDSFTGQEDIEILDASENLHT